MFPAVCAVFNETQGIGWRRWKMDLSVDPTGEQMTDSVGCWTPGVGSNPCSLHSGITLWVTVFQPYLPHRIDVGINDKEERQIHSSSLEEGQEYILFIYYTLNSTRRSHRGSMLPRTSYLPCISQALPKHCPSQHFKSIAGIFDLWCFGCELVPVWCSQKQPKRATGSVILFHIALPSRQPICGWLQTVDARAASRQIS